MKNLTNSISKKILIVVLTAFLFSGCAGLLPKPDITPPDLKLPTSIYKPIEVRVVVEETKPLVKQVLKKGEVAPFGGILFSGDSAKRILVDLAEYKNLKAQAQIDAQIIAAQEAQRKLLLEGWDMIVASNEAYRKKLESQKKWCTIKNIGWGAGGAAVGFGIGAAFK